MNMNMNDIEDKLASLYPMLKKMDFYTSKNIVGKPRQSIKKVGKNNSYYKKMG